MNKIIVIGASSGGLNPLRRIIAALPIPCTASVFIVMHLGNHPSILPSVLAASTSLNVSFAKDGSPIQPGRIYVAPPDHHMLLELGRVRLNRGPKVHHTRPPLTPCLSRPPKSTENALLASFLAAATATGLRAAVH
jgi:two-component system, chemotaxis family, protein-glutamate methylesterase/glutaminase